MTVQLHPKEIVKHIRKNWLHEASCPLCGQHDWSVQHDVYELVKRTENGSARDESVMPVIPVICKKCGNTVLVNGDIAGAVHE